MTRLAIHGGTPVYDGPQPAWPFWDGGERDAVLAVLESGEWGGFPEPNERASEFAARFAAFSDAGYGVCCANGSVSLEMCLWALDVKAGDEVIVPAYTWVATGAAPVHVNAVPVFVDVEPRNYCMDPGAVEAAITEKTVAIMPVHLASSIADMDRLNAIAEKHGLAVVEDCAHAHGSRWRDRGAGSLGTAGSYSFQSSKSMTAGEGGLVTTNDETLAKRLHSLVNCGRKEGWYEDFPGEPFGFNYRLTEFQAAVLLAQLDKWPNLHARREAGFARLSEGLAAIDGLSPVPGDPRETAVGRYQTILNYDREAFGGAHRNQFLAALHAEGFELDGPFYVAQHRNPLLNARSDQWPMLRERYGDGIRAPETVSRLSFPVTDEAADHRAVWMHYPYIQGGPEWQQRLLDAAAKIRDNLDELRSVDVATYISRR